jgi:hypothetical protein
MEIAQLWISDTLDGDGDLGLSITYRVCSGTVATWLDAEDRAALIEFLQRFPLPPTGQETEENE